MNVLLGWLRKLENWSTQFVNWNSKVRNLRIVFVTCNILEWLSRKRSISRETLLVSFTERPTYLSFIYIAVNNFNIVHMRFILSYWTSNFWIQAKTNVFPICLPFVLKGRHSKCKHIKSIEHLTNYSRKHLMNHLDNLLLFPGLDRDRVQKVRCLYPSTNLLCGYKKHTADSNL